MSVSAPELEAMIGRALGGKYRLARVIGRGGMGAVFEAENVVIGKHFAVKILDRDWAKDAGVVGRFAREARAASAVDSEHIVSVVDAGTDEGSPYIVMELLRGEDLGSRLRRTTRVPRREALHVAAQVLRGLAAAHAAGIVHRDLKPDNVILVEHAGDASFAKIVDFGISKIDKPRGDTAPLALTQRGVILGTPLYMAPEQARSLADVDGRADLFSVGAILFECLAGRPPHVGESYEQILLSICMEDAPDVRRFAPDVPANVAAIVARALARERAHRFGSALEMIGALRAVAPDDPALRPLPEEAAARVSVHSASPGPPTQAAWASAGPTTLQRRARARIAAMAIVATLAGAAATLGVLAMQRHTRAEAGDGPDTRLTAAAATATATAMAATATPASPSGASALPSLPGLPSLPARPVQAATAAAPAQPARTAKAMPVAPPPLPAPSTSRPAPAKGSALDIQRDLP